MNFAPIDENYAIVATLPVSFLAETETPPSQRLQRLLTKRQNAHNSVLQSIEADFKKINSQIDQEIWLESKTLKILLNKLKTDIEATINDKISQYRHDELSSLASDVFQNAKTAIDCYKNESFKVIDQFYQILQNLEKGRSNSFKNVLKRSYKSLQNISHKLPSEILEYFEYKILRLNEITLNNHHHYSILHGDLKLQIEDQVRKFLLVVKETEDRYCIALKKVQVRSLVDVKYLKLNEFFDEETKKEEVYKEESLQIFKKISEDVSFSSGVTDVEVWSRHIQNTLDLLDSNAKQLVKLYKMAVVNIFNRFFDQLQTITEALLEENKTPQSRNFSSINDEVFLPIINDIAKHYTCEVTDLQKLWNSITEYLQSNIRNTRLFLQSSAHLWDDHFGRLQRARELIQQDLLNHIGKNDETAQAFEKKLNKIVDSLRQESTIPKLNKLLGETNKVLDSVANLFSDQCEAEIKILEKYHSLIDQEIEVLLSEIQRFLGAFAEHENIKTRSSGKTPSTGWPLGDSNSDNIIPQQMKTCKYQVDAVSNWMFGLWEEIRIYMTTCRREISEQAESWVEDQASRLKKRLEVRLSVHKPRYERVKINIYQVRLEELQGHLKNLAQLEKALVQYSSEGQALNQIFRKQQEEVLVWQKAQIDGILDKSSNSKRSLQVTSQLEQAKAIAEETKKKLEENLHNHRQTTEEEKQKIQHAILHFTKSIKLFSEGGNYSRGEAKTFMKKIKKIEKNFKKRHSKLLDEANSIEPALFQKLESCKLDAISRLEESKEELQHKETVCSLIRKLQSEIYRRAHVTKYTIHRVDSNVDYLASVASLKFWKKKNFEIMKQVVDECLVAISELAKSLIYNGDLNELNGLIEEALNKIQLMTKEFYKKHTSQQDIMGEVTGILDKYRRQIEIHCIECAEDLNNHVFKFLKIGDQICEDLAKKDELSPLEEEIHQLVFNLAPVLHQFIKQLLEHVQNKLQVLTHYDC